MGCVWWSTVELNNKEMSRYSADFHGPGGRVGRDGMGVDVKRYKAVILG